MPFQYLIASAHWRQHVLSVGPGVLIPRPETEIFAGAPLEAVFWLRLCLARPHGLRRGPGLLVTWPQSGILPVGLHGGLQARGMV